MSRVVREYLIEQYGERIIDTFALGMDLKVHLMGEGVYNDAFDRPQLYSDFNKVIKDVGVALVEMVMEATEVYDFDTCFDTIEEWVEEFDDATTTAMEATLDGLTNDLLKFAKGGRMYQESL